MFNLALVPKEKSSWQANFKPDRKTMSAAKRARLERQTSEMNERRFINGYHHACETGDNEVMTVVENGNTSTGLSKSEIMELRETYIG